MLFLLLISYLVFSLFLFVLENIWKYEEDDEIQWVATENITDAIDELSKRLTEV